MSLIHTRLQLKVVLITIFISLDIICLAKSEPTFAYMTQGGVGGCGEFFDGIATIDGSDSYIFINRKGEEIGEAPGMMIHSDSFCRIFDCGKNFILTDKNNKVIKNNKDDIKFIAEGLYFLSSGLRKGGKLINTCGKVIKKYISDPVFYNSDGSPFTFISFKDKNKKSNVDVFKDGEFLFTSSKYIPTSYLRNDYPIISFYSYDKKTKKDRTYVFLKQNNKSIEFTGTLAFIPGINFIATSLSSLSHSNIKYFNVFGDSIKYENISTNSLGNRIIYDKSAYGYRLVDVNGNLLSDSLIQDVDPFYWQSGILAAKVNNKWGYFNQYGGVYLPFEYDYAGPRINNVCAVVKDNKCIFLHFYEKDTYRSIYTDDIKINNGYIHSYYVDNIDGNKVLFWEGESYKYGFYNLDKRKGIQGLAETPEFKDGMALNWHLDKNNDIQYCLLSLDGEIKAQSKNGGFFRYIGENLYSLTDFDKESDDYITYIYSKDGELLYDSKTSGVQLEGNFSHGVAPIFVAGGVDKATHNDYDLPYNYGYMYNTFSSSIEEVLMNYGNMGQDDLTAELNEQIKQRIEQLDYYQILGNRALEREDYKSAIYYFDKGISLYRTHTQMNFGKSIAHISIGEYAEALKSLQCVGNLPGANYARSLCYYNIGQYSKAQHYNSCVKQDDPAYEQSIKLKSYISDALQHERQLKQEERWNKAIAILGLISNGLQLMSQSMAAIQTQQQTYDTPSLQYNPSGTSNSSSRKECSFCHGTGLNSAKERAAFYSYSEETYSNSPCEICGDRDSHYHKPCPSCQGRRYVNF